MPALLDTPELFALHKYQSVRWVQRVMERELSLAEQALVVCACAYGGTLGPYNVLPADRWRSRLRPITADAARVSLERPASTFDMDGLTRLVFAAHDLGARADLSPCGGNRMELQVHLRSRGGCQFGRHPTLDQAVAAWTRSHHRPVPPALREVAHVE